VASTEVPLPTLNVEDTDGGGGGGQGSRRPSKLTVESAGEETTAGEPPVNVAELAATALQQLEPDVSDPQLAEVQSHRVCSTGTFYRDAEMREQVTQEMKYRSTSVTHFLVHTLEVPVVYRFLWFALRCFACTFINSPKPKTAFVNLLFVDYGHRSINQRHPTHQLTRKGRKCGTKLQGWQMRKSTVKGEKRTSATIKICSYVPRE